MKMKKKGDEEKDEFRGCKCRAYGMNGLGNKPIPVMTPKDALSLKRWMMGRELEEGLTRTPIIQRNSDRGGKEKAHLVGSALLSTLFFLRTFVIRGTNKAGAPTFRRKA